LRRSRLTSWGLRPSTCDVARSAAVLSVLQGRAHRFRKVLPRETLGSIHTDTKSQDRQPRPQSGSISPGDEYRLLVEGVQEYAMYLLDSQGRVATWNPSAERIEGYRADEIIGAHFSCFYQPHEVIAGTHAEDLSIATETGLFAQEG